MSTTAMPAVQVGPDTLITVKILFNGQNRRFKLALRDLGAQSLPQKLRTLLMIAPGQAVKFERFSDSVGSYVNLDSNNPAVYKQLYRAAKAKLKLRLRASIVPSIEPMASANIELATDTLRAANSTSSAVTESRPHTFFDTVLAKPKIDSPVFKPLGVPIQSQKGISVDDETAIHETLMQLPLSRPTLPTLNDFCGTTFNIECNNCGRSVPDEHFHCGKCEMGDFDLCTACIGQGVTCNGDDHWLLKRTIRNGKVITSSTETLPPKPKDATPVPAPVPAPAPIPVAAPISAPQPVDEDQRTCNSCIIQLAASSFVTCRDCADYDLCFLCLEQGQHGHHPAHIFEPVDVSGPTVSRYVKHLCQQGRGLKHEAVCDGCDSAIYGVRHKCLSCPDFDYCSTCVLVAPEVHRGHRFAPIYEQLGPLFGKKEVHKGIYCDGAICSGKARKTYIRGDRYKCTICHDTDFCANCEASPSSTHNKTHPLIKLRTPLQSLLVDTFDETHRDRPLNRPMEQSQSQSRHASTETLKVSSTNAATQVQTVAETAPIDPKAPVVKAAKDIALDLDAHFEAETTPDGTAFGPNHLISQSWTLRNPGPETWPEGCAIHYIGGDDMRNLNDKHPSPVSSMVLASSSNACHRPVRPGETFTFNVTLKSPNRQGRAVSYWRMKTAEGLPFGHKLWCDITVQRKEEEQKEKKKKEESKPDVADNSEAEKSNDSSQMIFPTLEKESPESSVANVRQEPVLSAPSVAGEDEDLIDDLESMTLEEGETDDGFLTDEEYDILDAEDEDTGKRRH